MSPDHEKSQELAVKAAALVSAGKRLEAAQLYFEAAQLERKVLAQLAPDAVRTRGILAVSAASLFYKARRWDEAEAVIFEAFARNDSTAWAREHLRDLLEVIWDERALRDQRLKYSGEEVLVSLRGGTIGYGTAPAETFLQHVAGVNSLLYRIGEWRAGRPLRTRGLPAAEVTGALQARVTQPMPGSYRFLVKLLDPDPTLFDTKTEPAVNARAIASGFFGLVEKASTGAFDVVKTFVPDHGYRRALLRLLRNLTPAGGDVREIEVKHLVNGEVAESLLLAGEVRQKINKVMRGDEPSGEVDPATIVTGTLRAVHLEQKWFLVMTKDHAEFMAKFREDIPDDVLGPMMNRRVVVRGEWSKQVKPKFTALDIELEE